MHIVHLLPELNQGGIETIVLSLNREFAKLGHQSTVISNGGSLGDAEHKINLEKTLRQSINLALRNR